MKIMWEEQLVDPSNEKITPLYLSDHNKQGANMKNITMEYAWCQNEDYVGGATC